MNFRRFLVWILLLLGLPSIAQAHQVDTVELEFLESEDRWQLIGEMDIAYMLPETRLVPDGLPLSRAAVMKSPPAPNLCAPAL